MKEKTYKKFFKYVLVILWMIIIFNFSKDSAEVSNGKSESVIRAITNMGIDINSLFGEIANFIIRKIGHFTEYFILCTLILIALKNQFSKKIYIVAIIITCLYACSDEIHQLFVPGRSGRVMDVLIDTTGGILSLIIFQCVCKWRKTQ